MSHGTEGAVRAESSLFELCRIASEEDEVKSRKSRKYVVTQIAQITQILYLSLADIAEIAEILFFRSHGNHGNYFRPRIDRMIRILYLSRKSQIAQKGFSDGFIEGGFSIYKNELLSYFSHHQWLIHLAE